MNKMLMMALLGAGMLNSGLTAKIRVYNTTPYDIKAIVYWVTPFIEKDSFHIFNIPSGTQQHWTRDVAQPKTGIDVWIKDPVKGSSWDQGKPLSQRSFRAGTKYKDYTVFSTINRETGELEYSISLSYPKGGTKKYPASDPK